MSYVHHRPPRAQYSSHAHPFRGLWVLAVSSSSSSPASPRRRPELRLRQLSLQTGSSAGRAPSPFFWRGNASIDGRSEPPPAPRGLENSWRRAPLLHPLLTPTGCIRPASPRASQPVASFCFLSSAR